MLGIIGKRRWKIYFVENTPKSQPTTGSLKSEDVWLLYWKWEQAGEMTGRENILNSGAILGNDKRNNEQAGRNH
jgi:hypothetical protein